MTHSPRAILQELGIRPLKRLGQNFLTDARVAERIASACDLTRSDTVVEIGPGTGALTMHLLARARRVVAIELDRTLAGALAHTLGDPPHLDVRQADVREVDLRSLAPSDGGGVIAGNVPYLITTDIVTQIIAARGPFDRAVLLVQKEYAARLSAPPNTAQYGALTVFVRQYAVAETVFTVGPGCFYPPPDVSSAVVRLSLRRTPAQDVRSADDLRAVVRAAFGMRRKVLGNALARLAEERGLANGTELCRVAGVDPRRRGETLDLPEFAALANSLPPADLMMR